MVDPSCLEPSVFAHYVQTIMLEMKGTWVLSAQPCSTFGSIAPIYFQMHIHLKIEDQKAMA